ncbi:hypothetical protein Tco_1119909 [Tanacetum coccineum]
MLMMSSHNISVMMKNQTMKMHQTLKEEYAIWDMEMELSLSTLNIDVWSNYCQNSSDLWKGKKRQDYIADGHSQKHMRRFHGDGDAKGSGEASGTSSGAEVITPCVFKSLRRR